MRERRDLSLEEKFLAEAYCKEKLAIDMGICRQDTEEALRNIRSGKISVIHGVEVADIHFAVGLFRNKSIPPPDPTEVSFRYMNTDDILGFIEGIEKFLRKIPGSEKWMPKRPEFLDAAFKSRERK